MFETVITLPDGSKVGTGLQIPATRFSTFAPFPSELVLSMDEIKAAARTGEHKGRTKFGKELRKNQGPFGSCNGWMIANMIAKTRRRRGLPWVDLSGAYAYSLMNDGRDNGSTLDRSFTVGHIRGVATLKTVPVGAIYRNQYNTVTADEEAKNYRAFEGYTINTEQQLASALVRGFDAGVAVHVGNAFMQLNPQGIASWDNGPGNHAVSVDGVWMEGDTLVYDMDNSWGVNVGDQGRWGLTWQRHFSQTIQYHPFYVIRSTVGK